MDLSKPRCGWCLNDETYIRYHDEEWGVPVHDEPRLFEMLNLEGAQAGLSWLTILRKRDNYRRAFSGFDPVKIVAYKPAKMESLLQDPGIVRNRLKVRAVVDNAQALLNLRQKNISFDRFLWQFTEGKTLVNHPNSLLEIPSKTEQSEAMSKELLRNGFRFVGPTICYAFMQAVGMVDDHLSDCWKRRTPRG